MQYRFITKNKVKVSTLGFGLMRFPILEEDNSKINKNEAMKMLQYLYENGVNYFDTAYVYHGQTSEELLGEFLQTIDRKTVNIATKLPMWLCKNYDDYQKHFDTHLERLKTNYIDFYLTHSLSKKTFEEMKKLNVFKFLEEKKKEGAIKYIGFSFHDELPVFKEIIDSYDWDFCQVQINYLDVDYQQGLEGIAYAKEKGIDVIVMEPLKGGRLANLPDDALKIFEENKVSIKPIELAQRWVYNQDIKIMLSGMSSIEQIKENLRIAETANDRKLTKEEEKSAKDIKTFLDSKIKVGCTACGYCMPCPCGVNIPSVFSKYNDLSVYGNIEKNKNDYILMIEKDEDARACIACGQCQSLCPQNLDIIDKLKEADQVLRK